MDIFVGDFQNICTMVTVYGGGKIDNTLHSQLIMIINKGKPKIVLNMERVKSWPPSTPNILLQVQEACLELGGDLIVANLTMALEDEISQVDKFRQLKIARSLGEATSYFRS